MILVGYLSMKIRLLGIVGAIACMLNGCECIEGPVDRPEEEQEYEETGVVLQYSTTVNGINLSYVIDDSELNVGETLSVKVDSENEDKPFVAILINDVEVTSTNELPYEYTQVMTESGEYHIVFKVCDALGNLYFNTSADISVE